MISTSTGTRVAASPSRRISTSNKRASSWKIAYSPDEKPKLYAKKCRTSNGDTVLQASPSVCEDGRDRISKCSKCGVMYRKMHIDPHGKEMVDRDWLCSLCSRSEDMRHAVSSVPTPQPTALQPSSKANLSPALPLPSMPTRISGGAMEAIDELLISSTFDDAENRCIADDPSVEWMDKSASVGVVGVTKPVATTDSPAVPLATKDKRPCPSRGDVWMSRVVLGAGNGSHPLWGSVKRSCYCGKTDATKPTARCVYCGSVFHPQCMDPPYPSVQSLPPVGYTCLMCRPACGMCGVGVSSKSSLNINCAECKLEFHRACVSSPLSRLRKGWKCCECILPTKPSDNADEDRPVEMEEHAHPVSTMIMPKKERRSKARGRAGSTVRSNGHLLTRRTAPNGILATSTTGGGYEGSKGVRANVPEERRPCEPRAAGTGRWTKDEHARFLKAIAKHSKQWKLVANDVRTRTAAQCRSHAQKHPKKLSAGQQMYGSSYSSSTQ